MQLFTSSCVVFLLSYFTLRYLKLSWEQQTLPSWSRYLLGLLAWGTLLAFLGMTAGGLFLLFLVMTQGDFGTILTLIALALGAGVIAKYANTYPELFDVPAMKPFLKDSLAFADPTRRRKNVFEELDRHEIRRVYKEMTGNELVGDDAVVDRPVKTTLDAAGHREWKSDGTVRPGKERRAELTRLIASPHLHLERDQLAKGETTDFTDSWKINTLKKSFHEFFSLVTSAAIIMPDRCLQLQIEGERFTREQLNDRNSLYRLKQNLYEFLHAVHEVPWMEPYLRFADMLACTCVQLEVDAFSGVERTPLLTVEISRSEIKAHAGGYFNAGEMKTTILITPREPS